MIKEKHSDFEHELPGNISARFFWRPYPDNATALLRELEANVSAGAPAPSAVALSTSLWHLLHVAGKEGWAGGGGGAVAGTVP